MYCPRCGQQQVSDQTKFCSRCGFQLSLVGELLNHGGTLPQLADLARRPIFSRRNGLWFSLFWFIFFLLIVAPFWGIVDVDELAGISAVIGIFGSLMLVLASFAFLKSSKSPPAALTQFQAQPSALYENPAAGALPPQQSYPVSTYAPPAGGWRADTSDLAVPGSVTEGTTKLLQKDEE